MSLYAYNNQHQPPAPFVHVTIRSADGTREAVNVPALIDTAADRTILPGWLVDQLGLLAVETITMMGFGGKLEEVPIFPVVVQIRELARQHAVSVGGNPEESWVLLGRDVLNHHRLVLDGPNLKLQIE